MTDDRSPYRFPVPDDPPTIEECQEAAGTLLAQADDGYWTPPQTVTPATPPEESRA